MRSPEGGKSKGGHAYGKETIVGTLGTIGGTMRAICAPSPSPHT